MMPLEVWPRFAVWMLVDPDFGVVKFANSERSRTAIRAVSALYVRIVDGGEVGVKEWRTAAAAVRASSAYAARCAAVAATFYDHGDKFDALEAAATSAATHAADAYSTGAYFMEPMYGHYKRRKIREAQADKILELTKK